MIWWPRRVIDDASRVSKTATAGAEHAVEGVHDDLQRLGQRRVVFALGLFAAFGNPRNDGRQAVPGAGERAPRKPSTDSLSSGCLRPSISPTGSIRKCG
jgi:hypothetical protein